MAVLGASCPANHQWTYPLHGKITFQGKIIAFNNAVGKQVDCIFDLWVYLCATI